MHAGPVRGATSPGVPGHRSLHPDSAAVMSSVKKYDISVSPIIELSGKIHGSDAVPYME